MDEQPNDLYLFELNETPACLLIGVITITRKKKSEKHMILIADLIQYLDRFYPRGRLCHSIRTSVAFLRASGCQKSLRPYFEVVRLPLFQINVTHSL